MLPKSFVLKPAVLFSSLSQQQQQKISTSETFLVMIFQSTQNFCIFSKKSKMPRNKKILSGGPHQKFSLKEFLFSSEFWKKEMQRTFTGKPVTQEFEHYLQYGCVLCCLALYLTVSQYLLGSWVIRKRQVALSADLLV